MKNTIKLLFTVLAVTTSLSAQSYPLSENTWSNPEFVDRFMGTFGTDTDKAPSINREEGEVFKKVSQIAAKNTAGAIKLLTEAITPESSGAMDFALANFLLQQKDYAKANASYVKSIKKFPNFGRAYKNLGLSHIQQGNFAKALPNLTKALEILGGDGGLFGLIAYCHLNEGNYGPALDAYKFALVYEPDSRDWRLGQLKALQNLRKYDEVEGIIYRYIQDNPNEPEFWLQQANAFIAQRKYSEAAANFEIVDLMNASDEDMLILLGDIYVNLDAPTLALAPYEKALAGGKVPVKKTLSVTKSLSRRLSPSEFKTFLSKVDAAYSTPMESADQLTLLTLKAANALALDEKAEAMTMLSQVVSKDPLNGSALLTLGSYYYGEADYIKSLDYYSRAEKVEDVKVEALLGSARVLVKQTKYYDAITRLKEAQTINDQPFIAQYISTLQKFTN